jgi:hypothetical protein
MKMASYLCERRGTFTLVAPLAGTLSCGNPTIVPDETGGNSETSSEAGSGGSGIDSDTGAGGSACVIEGEDVEVVVCGRFAKGFAFDHDSLFWVNGSGGVGSGVDCGDRFSCTRPHLATAGLTGGEPVEIATWEATPLYVSVGAAIVVATTDSVWRVDPDGSTHLVDPVRAAGIAFADDTLYWAAFNESSIWRMNLEEGGEKELFFVADGPILALDVHEDAVAWAAGAIHVLRPADDEPVLVAEMPAEVVHLHGDRVYWRYIGAVHTTVLEGESSPQLLIEGGAQTTVADGENVYSFEWGSAEEEFSGAIVRTPVDGGHRETIFVTQPDPPVRHMALGLHESYLYWSDAEPGEARIMRRRVSG